MQRRVLDLCCGRGGWSNGFHNAGWSILGVDIVQDSSYSYPFISSDVRIFDPTPYGKFDFVVASPPCQEFTRHSMPWLRAKNPPIPDTSIWIACIGIAARLNCPIIIENVRGAQEFMGKATAVRGSRYLWGNIPALLPTIKEKPKEAYSGTKSMMRSELPLSLTEYIASIV